MNEIEQNIVTNTSEMAAAWDRAAEYIGRIFAQALEEKDLEDKDGILSAINRYLKEEDKDGLQARMALNRIGYEMLPLFLASERRNISPLLKILLMMNRGAA